MILPLELELTVELELELDTTEEATDDPADPLRLAELPPPPPAPVVAPVDSWMTCRPQDTAAVTERERATKKGRRGKRMRVLQKLPSGTIWAR
jgi:hypothetical protein